MRLWIIIGTLIMMVLIPFFIWGETIEGMFSGEGAIAWLNGYGQWAWLAGVILLISDLLLPIPGTLIMSALGFIYGPWLGGILATLGSFLSGLLAFGLCRLMGEKGAKWILGEDGYEKGQNIFDRVGGWIVVLSRWLPVFPEVVACMAGMARMRPAIFATALLAGSAPLGFVFAFIGHMGDSYPAVAIILSAVLPPIIWLLVRPAFKRSLEAKS